MKLLSEKKNVSIGLMLSYVALAVSLVGSFFITPIILNNIGDSNYGLLSFCNSITSWLSIVSTALGSSFIFFINKERKENGSECKTNYIFLKSLIILSGIVAAITFISVFALKFSGFKFDKYDSGENDIIFILLLISGGNVGISIFFSAYRLFNNYKKSFVFVRATQILFSILGYVMDLVFAVTTKSIIAVALVALGSTFLNGLFNLIYAMRIRKMKFQKVKFSNSKSDFKSIVKYSSVILVSAIISNLDSNIDKTLLGIMVDSSSVTMYQLSITFAVHLVVVAYSFSEIMQPNIYYLVRNNKTEDANNLFYIVKYFERYVKVS